MVFARARYLMFGIEKRTVNRQTFSGSRYFIFSAIRHFHREVNSINPHHPMNSHDHSYAFEDALTVHVAFWNDRYFFYIRAAVYIFIILRGLKNQHECRFESRSAKHSRSTAFSIVKLLRAVDRKRSLKCFIVGAKSAIGAAALSHRDHLVFIPLHYTRPSWMGEDAWRVITHSWRLYAVRARRAWEIGPRLSLSS